MSMQVPSRKVRSDFRSLSKADKPFAIAAHNRRFATPPMLCAFAAAVFLAAAAPQANGQVYWTLSPSQTGDWSSGLNWSGSNAPTMSDYAYIDNGGTAAISVSDTAVCEFLYLGFSGTDSGTIQMPGGSLATYYNEFVGNNGVGVFMQSGGTNGTTSFGSVLLGCNSGSSGSYSLSGTGVLSSPGVIVGLSGSGAFTQTGGVESSGTLAIGSGPGSSGSYSLRRRALYTGLAFVGQSGSGTFTQSGGAVTLASGGSLTVGTNAGASGSYSLNSGQLLVSSLAVGQSGAGTFTQSGGSLTATNNEFIGINASGAFGQSGGSNSVSYLNVGSLGSYTFSGGTLAVVGGGLAVANQGGFNATNSTGTLAATSSIIDLSQATLVNTGSMSVSIGPNSLLLLAPSFSTSAFGNYSNPTSLSHNVGTPLTVPAGQGFSGIGSISDHVNCAGSITAAASGAINLNGGVTVSGTGKASLGNGSFIVNDSSGISGGSASLSALNGYVGNYGTGTFSQSGGNLTVTNEYVGNGSNSIGTFIQSGGTNNVDYPNTLDSNYHGLIVANTVGSSGSYTLSGSGALSAGTEYVGFSGTGTFTQYGGTNNALPYGNDGASLVLGESANSVGSYTLNGSGVLNPNGGVEYIGWSGSGAFTQTGGFNGGNCTVWLANAVGSSGSYALSGTGTLLTSAEVVGDPGVGTFNQTGGTNTITAYDGLALGAQYGVGTYCLSGSGLLHAYSNEFVGVMGAGTFNQTGGTNLIVGGNLSTEQDLTVGGVGVAIYNLSGGSLSVANTEYIEGGLDGTAVFNQSGGTNNVQTVFWLSGGTYSLSGGALLVPDISGYGVSTFNFGGGTLIANGAFVTSQPMTLTGSNGNANIVVSGTNSIGLFGALSGSGGLNVSGGATLTLGASGNYTGATTVSGSTGLWLANPYAAQNTTLNLESGSGLLLVTNSGQFTTFYVGALPAAGMACSRTTQAVRGQVTRRV